MSDATPEEADLALLGDPDEAVAREAFTRLADDARSVIEKHLRLDCRVSDAETRADIAQSVLLTIWVRRTAFSPQGMSAWHGYLRRTARSRWIDTLRGAGRLPTADAMARSGVPVVERAFVTAVLAAHHSGRLQRVADREFLGADPRVSDAQYDRRLLAAQLFYLDGEHWEGVLRVLGAAAAADGEALTREVLDDWLADQATLLRMAFRELHWDACRLASWLLGSDDVLPHEELDSCQRAAERGEALPAGRAPRDPYCTPAQLAVLLWRYRQALLREQILAREDFPLPPGEYDAVVDTCRAGLPFRQCMEGLLRCYAEAGADPSWSVTPLTGSGFWQRLALQYRVWDDLPHRDILERAAPPAEVVGYALTPARLNVWLSNGRLLSRLARACHAAGEGGVDDA